MNFYPENSAAVTSPAPPDWLADWLATVAFLLPPLLLLLLLLVAVIYGQKLEH